MIFSSFLLINNYKNYPFSKLLINKKRLSGYSYNKKIINNYCFRKSNLKYRLIDFNRFVKNLPGFIIKFELDPNRNCYIMLVNYLNGFFTYNLAPLKIKLNTFILNCYVLNKYFLGYSLEISSILSGTFIFNLFKISRAAGTFIILLRKFGSYCLVRLPSKEERFFYLNFFATVGRLNNDNYKFIKKRKAGYNINRGIKSKVRGVAKNPIDHPHGGGEGRSSEGKPSVTPWNVYTKGVRTTKRFSFLFNKKLNWGYFKRRSGSFW